MKSIIMAGALLLTTAALAQEVELKSPDGSITMRGKLVEFKDDNYIIDTAVGRITIDSSFVDCSGEVCPQQITTVPEITLSIPRYQANVLTNSLMAAYAKSFDAQASVKSGDNIALHSIFDDENEDLARIISNSSSSSESLSRLLDAQTDIAVASQSPYTPKVSESQQTKIDSVRELAQEAVISLDGLVFVASDKNPINDISITEAAMIFSGVYSNWAELGGMNAPIKLYGLSAESEVPEQFDAIIRESLGDEKTGLSDNVIATDDVSARVSEDPFSIGFTNFSATGSAKILAIRDVCGIAIPASDFTLKAEEYPFTNRLHAYASKRSDAEHAGKLFAFMQTDLAQQAMETVGYVDQRILESSIADQGRRFVHALASNEIDGSIVVLKDLVTSIRNSYRLSTTFRFETGSNQLDARGQGDLLRLTKRLQKITRSDTKVQLLGFTDTVGDFDLNRELSQRRATQIRDALLQYDPTLGDRLTFRVDGYGELSPIACNETSIGRSINRRVEVWLSN